MDYKYVEQLLTFIDKSPTPFHVVDNMKKELDAAGYTQLLEGAQWDLKENGKYYVIRNGASIIAFRIPKKDFVGYQIIASHSDFPAFKIKEHPEMKVKDYYVKLNVEKYGGVFSAPWLDRPLSIAGRAIVKDGNTIKTKLVNADRDLVLIPNLAIHINRSVNEGQPYNIQTELLPLYGTELENGALLKQLSSESGVEVENVIGNDLYLYNRMPGTIWGADREFYSAGRIDNIGCAHSSLKAFLATEGGDSVPMHCAFDNEECGSESKHGAASTFLKDVLIRINECCGGNESKYRRLLASSFMLSADNGHALHPNYPDKACPTNAPMLNKGIVLKFNGNLKYTTDGLTAAVVDQICEKAGVPYQTFIDRSDLQGGYTLGHISETQVSLNSADIGLPQLAMHSPYETAGVKDVEYMVKAMETFFQSSVVETGYGEYEVVTK